MLRLIKRGGANVESARCIQSLSDRRVDAVWVNSGNLFALFFRDDTHSRQSLGSTRELLPCYDHTTDSVAKTTSLLRLGRGVDRVNYANTVKTFFPARRHRHAQQNAINELRNHPAMLTLAGRFAASSLRGCH